MNRAVSIVVIVLMGALLTSGVAADTPSFASFGESPMLAERVERGELPPVEERLPEEPYVVTPIEEIGQYGGTAEVATMRVESWGDDHMMMSVFNTLLNPDPVTGELTPHFAREVEVSEDFTTYTVHFRRGVKWSDGEPFTAEDVRFWYEDVLLNRELTPAIGSAWLHGSEVVEFEVLDDYTVRFTFAGPKPFFREAIVHTVWAMFRPKHYLSQFHPAYVSEDELNQRVQEAGFNTWSELFANRSLTVAHAPMAVGLPTLNSYVLVEKTSSHRIYERNPYYWKVDTEGNQLPYIDRIFTQIVANREVYNGKLIAGELDFAGFETDVRNFPLYRRYEDDQNYRTLIWRSGHGNELIYQLNLTHNDEVLREIFWDVRFRRALSLAINRQEISEEIYFGQARPAQYTLLPTSRFHRPEYLDAYVEYDPDQARALLDEMGLQVGPDGYRLRPDGQRLTFTIENYDSEVPRVPNVELVMEFWNDIGIDVSVRPVSGELQTERAPANLMDATTWPGGSANDTSFPADPAYLLPTFPRWSTIAFTEWARWYQTGGQQGLEPPHEIEELYGWWQDILSSDNDEEIRGLADNILASQAENLWVIGTVSNAPYPLIARENLRNVPEEGFWGWPFLWSASWDPEQFFLRR